MKLISLGSFVFGACLMTGSVSAESDMADATTNVSPTAAQAALMNENMVAVKLIDQIRSDCIQNRRAICGRIVQVLPEGLVVDSGYTNLLRDPLMKSWLAPATVTAIRANNIVESREPNSICFGLVWLTDLPKKRGAKPHPNDYVIITGYPTGSDDYHSIGEVHKTVRRFSANLEKAIQHNFSIAYNQTPIQTPVLQSPAGR